LLEQKFLSPIDDRRMTGGAAAADSGQRGSNFVPVLAP
jgi:hypothetical protein